MRILTRKPSQWKKTVTGLTNLKGSYWESRGSIIGKIDLVSDDAKEVCRGTNIYIICGPAHIHIPLLEKIAPYAEKDSYVGTCYGQGAFDWMAGYVFGKKLQENNITIFGLQNVPSICKIQTYGESVRIIGPKKMLYCVAHPSDRKEEVSSLMETVYGIPTIALPNFLSITLTPSNQIIHPGRTYGVFKDWDGKTPYREDQIPLLYEQTDDFSADWMQILDDEIQAIKSAILSRYPDYDLSAIIPMKDRIIKQYGEQVKDRTNLKTVFCSNIGYSTLKFPTLQVEGGVIPNIEGRFFWEDIPFGLCILKDISNILGLETPGFDKMIGWHQKFMNKQFIINGKLNPKELGNTGAPSRYGIRTVEELLGISNIQPKL